jgi:hypothetical protein
MGSAFSVAVPMVTQLEHGLPAGATGVAGWPEVARMAAVIVLNM